MEPIYTAGSCRFAYQLNWVLTVFWREEVAQSEWLGLLRVATEPDGVRILEHRLADPLSSQFPVSTKPAVAPTEMIRSIKGRLQYLIRAERPRAFQRNHSFRSVGSANREATEAYVTGQHAHHPMADPKVQRLIEQFQFHDPRVDLSAPRQGAHGRFWYNLHIVLETEGGWRDVDEGRLESAWRMIFRAARAKEHLLSTTALLTDHVHLTLGCAPSEAPQTVAMSYLNNLAYAYGMRPVFRFSAYVGTVGEYDLNAIRPRAEATGNGRGG